MAKVKTTRKAYEEYLNELSPKQGSDQWIIGGKIRMGDMWRNRYGYSLRKHSPITFEVGYNEWKREIKGAL